MINRPKRSSLSSKSLSLIGIPVKFHNKTIEDFKTQGNTPLKEVKEYVKTTYLNNINSALNSNVGTFFYGSNGVGKTFLASLIAIEAYKHRYTVRRVTFTEYVSKYTKTWSNHLSHDEREVLNDDFYTYYKAVELLILEEVGKEIDSKIAAPILEDCLRYREDNNLTTIICTNILPATIKEKYGNSVMSLVKGNTTPILIESVDQRRDEFNKRGVNENE